MRAARATRFLTTFAGSVLVTGGALATGYIWAGLYMPWKGRLAVACVAALGIPWVLNKALTRSYRKLDRSASEWNSYFGMALATHLVLLPALYLGAGGHAGGVAAEEALRQGAVQAGFLNTIEEDTLASFPRSTVDAGITRVPNLGTKERPRVIARQDDGSLKAVYLPEAGEKIVSYDRAFLVGPAERSTQQVLLCPAAKDGERVTKNRVIRVPFEDGLVTFKVIAGSHELHIQAR